MVRAWSSFFGKKTEFRENEFTDIFISHIDQALKYKKFQLATELAQAYLINLDKRENIWVGSDLWPKVLEWSEVLWEEEVIWLKNHRKKEQILKWLPAKYFPTFRKVVEKIYWKRSSHVRFWNWHYFQQNYFPVFIKRLMQTNDDFHLFDTFKKHIDQSKDKLQQLKNNDKEKSQRYWHYFQGLFQSFCPVFFENTKESYSMWKHSFPHAWLVTSFNLENKDNHVARIILHQFIKWAEKKLKNKEEEKEWDNTLSDVEYHLFPEVDPELFADFLVMLFSQGVETLIKKWPNFGMARMRSYHGTVGDKTQEKIDKMWEEQAKNEKKTTFLLIKKVINSVAFENWNWLDEITMQKSIGKHSFFNEKALQDFKDKLNSKEIMELCNGNDKYEYRRFKLIEFAELLIPQFKAEDQKVSSNKLEKKTKK